MHFLSVARFTGFSWPYNDYVYSLTNSAEDWQRTKQECENVGAQLAVYGVRDYVTRLQVLLMV